MKNFITLLLLGIPMTAVSSEYVTIISKQNNAYDLGSVVPVETKPRNISLMYIIKAE